MYYKLLAVGPVLWTVKDALSRTSTRARVLCGKLGQLFFNHKKIHNNLNFCPIRFLIVPLSVPLIVPNYEKRIIKKSQMV